MTQVCFGSREFGRSKVFGRIRTLQSFRLLLENTTSADVSDSWLEFAARARPEAATCSKWPLEPTLEPENARKTLLALSPKPQNARQVPPESAQESQNARRVQLESRPGSTDAARATPEPQSALRLPLEPALAPQTARKLPLELAAMRGVRNGRSTRLLLVRLYSASSSSPLNVASCMLRARWQVLMAQGA